MANFPSYSKQNLSRGWPIIARTLLVLLFVSMSTSQTVTTNAITSYDGITPDEVPSFYRVDGTNGVKALLENREGNNLDYYVSMWIRSSKEQGSLGKATETVLDLSVGFTCGFTTASLFTCSSAGAGSISVDASALQTKMWVHFAISGKQGGTTYLRLDYAAAAYKSQTGTYLALKQNQNPWYALLGIGASQSNGFVGDIREFFMTQQYVASNFVPYIQNQLITWDPYIMGYYRLQNGNLNETFRPYVATLVQKVTTNPAKLLRDNGPSDICYPFVDQVLLPQINTGVSDGSAYSFSLDGRYSKDATTYKYTFSVWMKTLPGIQTTGTPTQGLGSHYFFKLDEAFALWFSDKTAISIYFNAYKNYYETWSEPIFFPMGQWANFQLVIDRVNGYEARVYDLQKRLQVTVKSNIYLPEQRPTGGFSIGNNFKGYMKSLMLWQTKQSLPIEASSGFETIRDGNLLLYYKFDNPSFYSSGQLPALNYQAVGGQGQTLVFGTSFNFNYQEWSDTTNYNSPSTIGTVFATTTTFDGVACNDKNLSPKTGTSSNTFMRFAPQAFTAELTAVTVEFWFKRTSAIQSANYLFTLYSTSFGMEFMSIYQDNEKNLTCAPFGSVNKNSLVKLTGLDSSFTGWQHLSCRYSKQAEVAAQYSNLTSTASLYFTRGLTTTTSVIPKGSYQMMVGNSYNKTMGSTNTIFKELRFWTSARTNDQITAYMFQQIDVPSNPSLIMYFRFGSGTDQITNYPTLYQGTSADKQGLVLTQDNELTVCPLTTFYNANTKKCHMNPFINSTISILSQLNDTVVMWTLSLAYSDVVTTDAFNNLTYSWTTTHTPLQQDFLSQYGNQSELNMTLTSAKLSPDYYYPLTLGVVNDKKIFSIGTSLNFAVQQCKYLVDKDSQTPVVIKQLKTNPGASDVQLNFQVQTIPTGCSGESYFKFLNKNVQWRTVPSYLNIQNLQTTYNTDTSTFTVTIPKSEQMKIPSQTEIQLIGTVFWDDDQTNVTSSIFLNIVYKLSFVSELQALITQSGQNVFIDQTLNLDASGSFQSGVIDPAEAKSGITYSWTCPTALLNACTNQATSAQLQITSGQFKASGAAYGTPLTFTLTVYRHSASSVATVTATWIEAKVPNFSLNARGSKIFATKDSYIDIITQNYESGSTDLTASYTITPTPVDASKISLIDSNTALQISTGALALGTSYTISVTLKYKTYTESKTTTTVTYSTGTIPYGGTVSASPTSGIFLETTFTIGIANWVTSSQYAPVKFYVYGQSSSSSTPIDLSKQYYNQGETYKSTFPQLTGISVMISDSYGEITKVDQPLTVTMPVSQSDYSTIINNIKNQQGATEAQKITSYSYVVAELNNKQDVSTTYTDRQSILTNIQSSIDSLQTSNDAQALIQSTMPILPLLSSNPSYMNDAIATSIIAVVQKLQTAPDAFNSALLNQQFRADYATTLSNMFTYANSKIQTTPARRLLSDTVITVNSTSKAELKQLIKDLIKAKNDLMDQVCGTMKELEVQERISTEQFNVIIEKIGVSTQSTSRSYYDSISNSFITVPLKDILTKSAQDPKIEFQCLQVTLYRFNTLNGYMFQNQTQNSNVLVQLSTLSSTGSRLVESSSLTGLQQQFTITFPYDYRANEATFKTNQTVCMIMSTQLSSYEEASWTTENCITSYNKDKNSIGCQCSSVGPNFYGIFTDTTRYSGPPIINENPEESPKIFIAFDNSALSVIIILLTMMLGLPIIAVLLDKMDYSFIKDTRNLQVTEELLLKFAQQKRQPLEQVVYLKKLIYDYQHVQTIAFSPIFMLFMKYLHPLFGIFGGFNVKFKRLIRQTIVVLQASVIAIIVTIIFASQYKGNGDEQTGEILGMDVRNAIIAGFVLMILTLPPPQIIVSCLFTRFALEKDLDLRVGIEQQPSQKVEEGVDDVDLSDTQNALQKKLPRNMRVMPENYTNERVAFFDKCIGCKVIMFAFTFVTCIIAVIVFGVASGNISKSLQAAMMISWFLAFLGGMLILNTLRILFIALLAPEMARIEMEGHTSTNPLRFLVPRDAVEMLKDLMFVKAETNLSVHKKKVYNKTLQQTYNSGSSPNHNQFKVEKQESPLKRNKLYLENSVDIEVQLPRNTEE